MRLAQRSRILPRVPLAPMGDIAFLLIIFFMVTSVFIREAHLEVTLPEAAEIERLRDAYVSVTMDRDGKLWLQGEPCGVQELLLRLDTELGTRADKTVMLKIDKDVHQASFAPLLRILSETGARIAWLGQDRRY